MDRSATAPSDDWRECATITLPPINRREAVNVDRYVVETSAMRHATNDKTHALNMCTRMARNAGVTAIIFDNFTERVVFTEYAKK